MTKGKIRKNTHHWRKEQPKWTPAYWHYFVHEHSLSIVLALVTIVFKIFAALVPEGYWKDFCQGMGDDSCGALLIVVCTKYFIERGSPNSK